MAIQLILLSRVHAENAEARRIAVRLAAEGAAQETRARKQAAVDCYAVCFRTLVPCAVGLLSAGRPVERR